MIAVTVRGLCTLKLDLAEYVNKRMEHLGLGRMRLATTQQEFLSKGSMRVIPVIACSLISALYVVYMEVFLACLASPSPNPNLSLSSLSRENSRLLWTVPADNIFKCFSIQAVHQVFVSRNGYASMLTNVSIHADLRQMLYFLACLANQNPDTVSSRSRRFPTFL